MDQGTQQQDATAPACHVSFHLPDQFALAGFSIYILCSDTSLPLTGRLSKKLE